MADADEERSLVEQRNRDLAELYPTAESWERGYPPTLPPQDAELRQQYDDFAQMSSEPSRVQQALKHGEASTEIGEAQEAKRQRDLNTHNRMTRGAAEAARDALHDGGPDKTPGAYTAFEARDRAAHIPPAHKMEPDR